MKRSSCHLRKCKLPLAIVGALTSAISATYAPVVSAQNSLMLEEIVVTVRRRVEMEQDVPISMKAMTGDFLRSQNITQIEDLGTKVPSMRISGAGGSLNEPIISLRGQRPAESVFSQEPAVPMYFNEVAMAPAQGSNLGLYDLQSLQVLKGPQGTLFGKNSTGGAVLMTPTRPGHELGGYAEVTVGDYNLIGFEGAVDVPISDSFTSRIAVHKLDRDGYQENVADNALKGEEYHDEHSQGVRFSLSFNQGGLSNLLVLAWDENDIAAAIPYTTGRNRSVALGSDGLVGATPTGTQWAEGVQRNIDRDDPWTVETDLDSEEYVENIFASNTTEFELTDELTIKNVFGYRKVDFETITNADGTAAPAFGGYTVDPSVALVTTGSDLRPTVLDSEFYSNELQLLGTSFDDDLEWIIGAYWSEMDATQDYLVQTSYFRSVDSGISTAVNTSYGLFSEGTYTFTDEWSLTLGLRQSWDKRELTVSKWNNVDRLGCNVSGPGGAALIDCERTVDETFDAPTFRISANYTPEDLGLIYSSISTGYRAGGFNTRGKEDATLQPFDEEVVTTFELGHKNDWDLDFGSLRTSVAVYWQDYEDIHHTRSFDDGSGTGALVTRTENAAEAEIKGLEFDVTVAPVESLLLSLSYSYVDAEFKEKFDLIDGVEVDTSSNEFPYIPEQSATFSATYTLPLDASLGDMSIMASLYWQDEMATHPLIDNFDELTYNGNLWSAEDVAAMTEFSEVDSYEVWNIRFDWRNVMDSNFDFAAYMNNVTDEDYVLGGLNVVDSGGYGAYLYGAPQTIGASLRYTF